MRHLIFSLNKQTSTRNHRHSLRRRRRWLVSELKLIDRVIMTYSSTSVRCSDLHTEMAFVLQRIHSLIRGRLILTRDPSQPRWIVEHALLRHLPARSRISLPAPWPRWRRGRRPFGASGSREPGVRAADVMSYDIERRLLIAENWRRKGRDRFLKLWGCLILTGALETQKLYLADSGFGQRLRRDRVHVVS